MRSVYPNAKFVDYEGPTDLPLDEWVPTYREWLGLACQVRGQLRADGKRVEEARADFDRSQQLLEALVKEFPEVPAHRADLGRTYAGLGWLARSAGDKAEAAEWFSKATQALRQAIDQAPDHAENRRSLRTLQAELQTE